MIQLSKILKFVPDSINSNHVNSAKVSVSQISIWFLVVIYKLLEMIKYLALNT